jgi:hypothetical protein
MHVFHHMSLGEAVAHQMRTVLYDLDLLHLVSVAYAKVVDLQRRSYLGEVEMGVVVQVDGSRIGGAASSVQAFVGSSDCLVEF